MNVIYETDRLCLVPFLDMDLEQSNYYNWFHDQEITEYNSHGLFPYTKKEEESYFKSLENNDILVWAIMMEEFGLVEESINNHIGNVSLQRIDWINRSAEVAVVIGEKDYWGKGIATEALSILIDHGFEKLNLHRIWSGTANTNKGMIRVFKKLGLSFEGQFIDGVFLNGRYENVVCYSIIKS